MPSSERQNVPAYQTCGCCERWARGRSIEFGVGWKSRGQNPRTLVTDLRVLKVDAVVVCEACERRLLWRGAGRRFGREILKVHAFGRVSERRSGPVAERA